MRRSLKICCGVTTIFLITSLVVLVVLFLTVLKPKDPKIVAQPVTMEGFKLEVFPVLEVNISLGILVTVDNRNYGSFKYENSTAYVTYRGDVVAEAPIEDDTIPARGKHNISSSVNLMGDKLVKNVNFLGDAIVTGILNFTSTTTLHGKASLFKLFKMKGTSYCTCDISVSVQAKSVDSVCKSRFTV